MTFMQYTSDVYLKNFFLKLCVLLVTITVSCSSDPIIVGSSGSNNGSGNSSGGSGTTTSDLNINNNLNEIFFTTNGIGYVIGDGIVLKTLDNGNTWAKVKESSNTNFTSIYFENSKTGLIGGGDGYNSYLYLTTDGGVTWAEINSFWNSNESLKNMAILSSNSAQRIMTFINTYPNSSQVFGKAYNFNSAEPEKWKSYDLKSKKPGIKSAIIHKNLTYVASAPYWTGTKYETSIFVSDFFSNTISFEEYSLDYDLEINDLYFNDNYGYFVADDGRIGISSNFKDWTIKSLNINAIQNLKCIDFINDEIGFILESKGKLLKTNDSGFNWIEHLNLNNADLNDFFLLSENKILIIGNDGFLNIFEY